MSEIARQPVPIALGYCGANWLVPGLGYFLAKDHKRGIALFLILNGIFFGGLLFSGHLYIPAFSIRDPSFNIVAILTFLVQVCHAGGCLILTGAQKIDGGVASLLVRDPAGAYSDLGSFHFLVAGALNYFATVRLYDLLAGDPDGGVTPSDKKASGEEKAD